MFCRLHRPPWIRRRRRNETRLMPSLWKGFFTRCLQNKQWGRCRQITFPVVHAIRSFIRAGNVLVRTFRVCVRNRRSGRTVQIKFGNREREHYLCFTGVRADLSSAVHTKSERKNNCVTIWSLKFPLFSKLDYSGRGNEVNSRQKLDI